jgi:hypothetical protein
MTMATEAPQTTTLPRVYKITHSLEHHLPEDKHDAWLLDKFPGWKEIDSGFRAPVPIVLNGTEGTVVRQQNTDGKWLITTIQMPERVRFEGIEDLLRQTDYPYTRPSWPVMSKRMLEVLLSVRNFPCQAIPITIKDDQMLPDEQTGNWIRSGIENHNYVLIQLLEHLDVLDKENSTYSDTGIIRGITLREPEAGYPPIFRVSGDRVPLYVSAEAKTALEAADIKGVQFSTYQLSSLPHTS